MDLFSLRIKPDLSKFSDEQIFEQIKYKIPDFQPENIERNYLILKFDELWKNNPIDLDSVCPICLDHITNSDFLITPCTHYFHSTCMLKLVYKTKINNNIFNFKCPSCRQIIFSEQSSNTTSPIINQPQINNLSVNHIDELENGINSNLNGYIETIFDPVVINPNNINISQNLFEDISFPINLHTGMWTDINFSLLNPIYNNLVNLSGLNEEYDQDYNEDFGEDNSQLTISSNSINSNNSNNLTYLSSQIEVTTSQPLSQSLSLQLNQSEIIQPVTQVSPIFRRSSDNLHSNQNNDSDTSFSLSSSVSSENSSTI